MSELTAAQAAERRRENWLEAVSIRQLQQDDLPALEWEGAYIHFRRVYAQAYARAQAGRARLWVAAGADGYLYGQLFVLLTSDSSPEIADGRRRAFIHSFRVRPEYRRGGLGARLLAHAEQDLRQSGFRSVFLNVVRDNADGLRFYLRHGYRKEEAQAGRWTYLDHLGRTQSVHEESWRMRKDLLRRA